MDDDDDWDAGPRFKIRRTSSSRESDDEEDIAHSHVQWILGQPKSRATEAVGIIEMLKRRQLFGRGGRRNVSKPVEPPRCILSVHEAPCWLRARRGKEDCLVDIAEICASRGISDPSSMPILAVSHDARWMVRHVTHDTSHYSSSRADHSTDRLFHAFSFSPAGSTLEQSLYIEDIPATAECLVSFSERDGVVGVFSKTLNDLENGAQEGSAPIQGLFRVDLLVPWATVQLSSVCAANFALRLDDHRKRIRKRFLRVHSRGAVLNAGYHVLFLTVTSAKALTNIDHPWRQRRTWALPIRQAPLGVVTRPGDRIEKPFQLDIGESIMVRSSMPFLSRQLESNRSSRHALFELTHPTLKDSNIPLGKATERYARGTEGATCCFSRQDFLIEPFLAEVLSKWYDRHGFEFLRLWDYEVDILSVDETKCVASMAIAAKLEVRPVKEDANRQHEFHLSRITFEWYILEGRNDPPKVIVVKRVPNAQIFSRTWYTVPAEYVEKPHEMQYSDKTEYAHHEFWGINEPSLVVRDNHRNYMGIDDDDDFLSTITSEDSLVGTSSDYLQQL